MIHEKLVSHDLLTLKLLRMSLFLLLNTKEDILKNVGHQTVDGSHDLHSMEKILLKSMVIVNYLVTNVLQNIFFCDQ